MSQYNVGIDVFEQGCFTRLKREIFGKLFLCGGFDDLGVRKETLVSYMMFRLPKEIESQIKRTYGCKHGMRYYTSFYLFFGIPKEQIKKRFTFAEVAWIIQKVFETIEHNEELLLYFV